MESHVCGKCTELVSGIEPAICGACDGYYHVGRECSGISRSEMNSLFTKGVAIWICPKCRPVFGGTYIRDVLKTVRAMGSLQTQFAELAQLVQNLDKKVDNNSCKLAELNGPKPVPVANRRILDFTAKQRRGDNGGIVSLKSAPAPTQGTKVIDLSDLSVPDITPEPAKPVFWLYLTGFHPLINDDDVHKIVSRSLEIEDTVQIEKLVTKGADLSKYSFISFKVGLNPDLKEKALLPSTWPWKIRFREFENYSTGRSANRTSGNYPSILSTPQD